MSGIQAWRNWSAPVSPPTWPPVLFGPAQVPSWPSLQRLGVMKPKRGVVLSLRRSWARCPTARACRWRPSVPSGTTLALHSAVLSMTEWNQTNGLCRVGVLVGGRGHLGVSVAPIGRVAAVGAAGRVRGPAVARRRVAHVLLVGAPGRDVGLVVGRVLRRRAARRWS